MTAKQLGEKFGRVAWRLTVVGLLLAIFLRLGSIPIGQGGMLGETEAQQWAKFHVPFPTGHCGHVYEAGLKEVGHQYFSASQKAGKDLGSNHPVVKALYSSSQVADKMAQQVYKCP